MHEVMKIIEENMDDHFYNFGLKEASLNVFCFKPEMIKSKDFTYNQKILCLTTEKFSKALIIKRLKHKQYTEENVPDIYDRELTF